MNNNSKQKKSSFQLAPVCAAVLLTFGVQTAQANPVGAAVVNGQASFNASGNTLTVTNTPGTIINWQGFSIQQNEITRFAQQSASSTVLNRVVTNNPSQILGTLQSNGRVFLVNPNGIIFGAGSTVDVAGLVATTLNLSNADFLAGRHNFTQVPGAANISNAGNLNAQSGGEIYLIAPNVENTGIITAPNGDILLAAGHEVQLVNSLDPNLRVNITAPAGDATNVGQLVASAGQLGLFGTVVRNTGTVSADSATLQGGKILFKASQTTEVGGTVSATGTTGGEIAILGNQVALVGNANVDAAGVNGGGTVLIGGDAHGANPNVQNSQFTYVDATATIKADASQNGNGGKVVVWADKATQFNGNISTRGGALSGNGGWVETSGKQMLGFAGLVDTTAAHGTTGSLLLDPVNITISTAASTPSMTWSPGTLTFADIATGGVTTSNLQGTVLIGQLNSTNVMVDTTSTPGLGVGNIDVQTPIAWASANSLTLNATGAGAITTIAGATITNTGTGGLSMVTAGGNIISNAVINLAGAFTATANGAASTISINAPLNTGTGAINLTAAGGINATGGMTTAGLLTTSGGTTLSGTNNLGSLSAATSLSVTGGATTVGGAFSAPTVNASAGALNLNNTAGTTLATLNMTGGTLSNAAALNVGTLNVNGFGGTISGAGLLTTPAASTVNIGVGLTAINKTWNNAGTVNFTNGGAIWLAGTSGTFNNQAGGVLNYNGFNSSPVSFGTLNTVNHMFNNAGTLNKNAGSAVAQSIDILFNNTGTVNVNSGTLTLSNSGTDTGAYNIATGTTLNLSGGTRNLNTGAVVTGTGNVTVAPGGALNVAGGTLNSALVNNGATTFASSSGAYTGAYSGTGALTLDVNGGAFSFAPTLVGGYVFPSITYINLGNLNFDVNATIANLNLQGSSFRGAGAITIAPGGTLTVAGTTLGGFSALNVSAGATANFSNAAIYRPLTNLGTMNVTGISTISTIPSAAGPNNGSLTNGATGVLNLNSGYLQPRNGGFFTNNAGGQVIALTGYNTIDATGLMFTPTQVGTITNNGSIAVNAGATLVMTDGFASTNSGTYTTAPAPAAAPDAGGLLTFNRATGAPVATYTYSGSLINNGTMNFFGAGNAITGTLTQTGMLNVAPGVTLAAPGFTNMGTLSGGGTFNLGTGTLTNNGIISPGGTSIVGTLAVTGNLLMGSGGSLNLDINGTAAGQYDVLNVSGTANLTNGTLKLYGVGVGSYPVLNAAGGLGGTKFGTINSGTFTQTPAYSSTNLTLGVTANSIAGYIYWSGGAGTNNWADALNWSNQLVPASADNLYISPSANTVYVTAGTQFGNALVSDANLNLAGGSLALAGNLNLPGTFTVSGGTWNQVAATLPAFNVGNFNFTSGTFIRALGGNGTIATPYLLTDIYGVQGMASALASSYVLANNINASGTVNWNAGAGFSPIGSLGYSTTCQCFLTPFSGQFNGQGNTISNLSINRPAAGYVGLFGNIATGGTVSNLGLLGSNVIGSSWVGALAGENNGNVSNSYVSGGTVNGSSAGGMVGYNYGSISNSYSSGVTVSGYQDVGGLAGQNSGTITNTYSGGGTVSGTLWSGGLVGENWSIINTSYSTNIVAAGGSNGGLTGWNEMTVFNSYWDTQTSGQSTSVGGTGLTTAQMKTMSSFAGWSIANTGGAGTTWRIYEGSTTPLLTSFLKPLSVTANAATKTYNGLAYSGGNGVTYSVASPVLSGTLAYGGTSQGAVNAGSYVLAPTGLFSGQQGYDISYVNGTLAINSAVTVPVFTTPVTTATAVNTLTNMVVMAVADTTTSTSSEEKKKAMEGVAAAKAVTSVDNIPETQPMTVCP